MRAATYGENGVWVKISLISIHAAHAGSDSCLYKYQAKLEIFQSTLPMRAATR